MFTDNTIDVDMAAMGEVMQRADVLTIGFSVFAERLLIDVRSSPVQGPLVTIVGPVATVQERYMWLGQHRGAFGAPEAFSFIVWPKSVRNLVERDGLAPMARRLMLVSPEAAATLHDELAKLAWMERESTRMAIRGEGPWKTIWGRR